MAIDKIDVTKGIKGIVPAANLGSGTASSSTVLYGDNTFKAEPSSVTGTSGFLAHGDSGTNQTISGAHAWTQITTFGTERYDIGNDFASHVFTAPADGKYYLSFRLTFANISGSFLKLRLQPLNNDLASNGTDGGDGNDHKTLGYSYILDMTSGQSAYPQVYSSVTTVQVINNNGSYFCGMRIA
jgi:hypothetical protein